MRPLALGGLAFGLALRGQTLLPNELTRPQGTRWYAAGIMLLILAWRGTYKNKNLASLLHPERDAGEGSGNGTEGPVTSRWTGSLSTTRYVIALAALLLNLHSVARLRAGDYSSLSAGLGWLASLLLLAAIFAWNGRRPRSRDRTGDGDIEERTDIRPSRHIELVIFMAIFVLALCLRLYRLGDWTSGMHGDEGEVGMDALRILEGHWVSPFRTGWFGQPNFYYWGVALSMKLFGTGLFGLRMFSALAGAMIILPFYPLVRQLFGVRTAILASIFLAISDVAIHFSRQEFSNITTPLFLVTGFFFLFRGLRDHRPVDFVLAGYAHMLCLYFYLGGRLTPIIVAAFFVYLLALAPAAGLVRAYRDLRSRDPEPSRTAALLEAGRRQVRRARPYYACTVLYALAACCFASPWIAYYFDHRQEWDARVHEKLAFNQPGRMAEQHGATHDPLYVGLRLPRRSDVIPLPIAFERTPASIRLSRDGFWPRAFWGQLKATLSILTYRFDASEVYTFTMEPVTKPIEAVLVVFGVSWALLRWRDVRMALLSLWFWLTVLVGGVLTIDAPYMARLVGIVPALAIFAALILNKLAAEFVDACRALSPAGLGARVGRPISSAMLASVVGFLTWQNATDYYGRYLGRRPFTLATGQAYFVRQFNAAVAKEGRPAPRYYSLGAHVIYWGYGVNRFLNYGIPGGDVANVSDALPILDNGDRDAVFMVWEVEKQYLPVIRTYYPDGQEGRFAYGPTGHEAYLFTYYRVKREEIEARRTLEVSYVPARGAPIQRREGNLGSASPLPAGLTYPVSARWKGNLFVPAFGLYRFRLDSAGPASLVLDEDPVLASGGQTPVECDVTLARGTHNVSLQSTLPGSDSKVVVQWSAGDSAAAPVPRRFLWSGPGRSLLGEVRPFTGKGQEGERSLCDTDASSVTQRRLDGFLGFRDAPNALRSGGPLMACWKGDLDIVQRGLYQFEIFANGGSTMFIDGKLVVDNRHGNGPPRGERGQVELSPGKHRLELQYFWVSYIGYLEVYWAPPGGQRTILGPEQLSAKGGLWWPGQVADPPAPAPQLFENTFVPAPAAASPQVADTRGCALDRRGELYVADAAHHRLAVFDKSGKLVRSWGSEGREPGNFVTVEDVSIGPAGLVYVLDSALARVLVFTPDGHLVRTLEGVGCSPAGFTVAADGSVYVASTCGNAVHRYAPSGKQPSEYRAGSDSATRLEQPVDVAVGPDGVIYVADLRDRIVKLDPSSDTIEKSWPVHVGRALGGANLTFGGRFLYLTDPDRSVLYSIDTETGRIETLRAGSGADLDAAVRGAGVGPCATPGMAAFARSPLCLGELLARCRDGKDLGSPQ